MLKPQGYATIVGHDRTLELDTAQCGHCGKVMYTKPGTLSTVYIIYHRFQPPTEEPGAACSLCRRPVCLPCHDDGRCITIEHRIEHSEKTGEWLV